MCNTVKVDQISIRPIDQRLTTTDDFEVPWIIQIQFPKIPFDKLRRSNGKDSGVLAHGADEDGDTSSSPVFKEEHLVLFLTAVSFVFLMFYRFGLFY